MVKGKFEEHGINDSYALMSVKLNGILFRRDTYNKKYLNIRHSFYVTSQFYYYNMYKIVQKQLKIIV